MAKKWEQIPKKSRLDGPGLSWAKDIPLVLLDPNDLNMTKISECSLKSNMGIASSLLFHGIRIL